MAYQPLSLEQLEVASPCTASWSDMKGDATVRFCGQCRLHVYNLSGMGREKAEELVRRTEGQVCVRFYRRSDGTVLTTNCPVGFRAAARLARGAGLMVILGFMALLGAIIGAVSVSPNQKRHSSTNSNLLNKEPFRTIINWLDPPINTQMGELCPPPSSKPANSPDQDCPDDLD